jgi:NTE family protein
MGPRRVLVLGGGGVRGLAHLGIIGVLEEHGIGFDAIVGTSAGAIIGGMYAVEADAKKITARVIEFLTSSAFRRLNLRFDINSGPGFGPSTRPTLFERLLNGIKRQVAMELLFRRPSIFKTEMLEILIRNLIGDKSFEDARIPMHVTALDLRKGRQVLISSGKLVPAVVASSSVPGFFPPVEVGGELLCDIGTIDNMPVGEARAIGATQIIAVSLNASVAPMQEFPSGMDVIFRTEEIGTKMFNDRMKGEADALIEPDLEGRFWLDFSHPEEVVAIGAEACRRALPQILAVMRSTEIV